MILCTNCLIALQKSSKVSEMTIICRRVKLVASSTLLQTNHLDQHVFELRLPTAVPPRWLLGMPQLCTVASRIGARLHFPMCLGAVLLLAQAEFWSPKSWYFPSSLQFFQVLPSTSQVVCHLPPTAICHRPKLRSRLQSRRKKCGFDETQFPKFIPNSLTLATGTLVIAVYSPKPVDQFQSDALKLENVFS